MPIQSLIREPLVHFALLGAVLYGVYVRAAPGDERRITVAATTVEALRDAQAKRLGRAPSAGEVDAAVREYVEDEVLYREALALNLDEGDLIVKRRLAQKMRFIAESMADAVVPSDDELRAYWAAHAADYREPARIAFKHVFARSGSREPKRRAAAFKKQLDAGAPAERVGDAFLHGASFGAQTRADVARTFGEGFAAAIVGVAPGAWTGPIASSYGLHWVFVTARSAEEIAAFEQARPAVERDWRAARRAAETRRVVARLVERYDVQVSPPAQAAQVTSR